MTFKITLPEANIDPEFVEKRNRAMLSEDFAKGGMLAKVLVFTYLHHPISTTELTTKLNDYFKLNIDRASIYRTLQKLVEKHLIATTTTGVVMHMTEGERSEIHKKIIHKYYEFLEKIPDQFRKKFQNINYFWVANGEGTKYIEWCCKLLKFKCEGGESVQ